ncbi:MAG: hypothetical protein AAFY35_06905 [Pseudomonadota bacterium]
MLSRWALGLLCCVGLMDPAQGSEILGTTLLEGRKVEILADGTWVYAEALPDDCQTVTSNIMLCAEKGRWTSLPAVNADIAAQFRFDDSTYGLLILEELGHGQGITFEAISVSVLEIAASAAGVRREDIPVINVQDTALFGEDAQTITYAAVIDGLPITYRNTILIEEEVTIQAVTYEVSRDLTQVHTELHDEFLQGLQRRE